MNVISLLTGDALAGYFFGGASVKIKKDKSVKKPICPRGLPDQDSNLDRQNQNLQYYRYTIGQLTKCKLI